MVALNKGKEKGEREMKKLLPISVIAIFVVAPTFADNITASSTCTNGVLGTYTGPADIEANFNPNTINTTWYSNGTQLTGNNIPATCTYDNALIPPTPEDRPGYVFGGWSVIVPCLVPASLIGNNASAFYGQRPMVDYIGSWNTSWSNGDKVVGEAICSGHYGNNHNDQYGGDSADWISTEEVLLNAEGEKKYCWCKATSGNTGNGFQSVASSSWVFSNDYGGADDCANDCAVLCAYRVFDNADFRRAVFGVSE